MTEPPLLNPKSRRDAPAWAISPLLLGLALVIAVSAAALYFLAFRGPAALADKGMETVDKSYTLARRVAHDVIRALQIEPRVRIGSEVVYEQTKGILELATAQRTFAQTYYWEQSWLGSTKKLELRGTFIAKAGYDMTKPFVVDITPDGRTVRARVPPAKILSVELVREVTLQDENGIWNELKPEDREAANNSLLQLARTNVDKSNLRDQADVELMRRLQSAAEQQQPARVDVKLSHG